MTSMSFYVHIASRRAKYVSSWAITEPHSPHKSASARIETFGSHASVEATFAAQRYIELARDQVRATHSYPETYQNYAEPTHIYIKTTETQLETTRALGAPFLVLIILMLIAMLSSRKPGKKRWIVNSLGAYQPGGFVSQLGPVKQAVCVSQGGSEHGTCGVDLARCL